MSIIETVTDIMAPKRRGRPPLPGGDANTPASVQQKIATSRARLDILLAQRDQMALAATLEAEPGPASAAYEKLKADIAEQERLLADLDSALRAAKAADARLLMQQQAALRKAEITAIRRDLRARDDAARQ